MFLSIENNIKIKIYHYVCIKSLTMNYDLVRNPSSCTSFHEMLFNMNEFWVALATLSVKRSVFALTLLFSFNNKIRDGFGESLEYVEAIDKVVNRDRS